MNPIVDVDAAYYGVGVIFPVIVLGTGWHQPAVGALPVRALRSEDLLVLRWCGPHADPDEDNAVAQLQHAARQAPDLLSDASALALYREQLPSNLRLTVLRPSALIGPWANRPGRGLPHEPNQAA